MAKPEKRRLIGYLVGSHEWGLMRWAKSDSPKVPWTLYSTWTRPTIFPDRHAAQTAIRQAAKYWSQGRFKPATTAREERGKFRIIRVEAP